jgi:diguanylate cyclase (GGDEF)-like protein
MKIVSPGTVVREAPEILRRTRLARLTCVTIVAGWTVSALIAVLGGASPSRNAWLLTGVGIITGITWAARRWDEQSDRALQILLVAASLQAAAGTLAFDRGEIVAAPVFALMLAPLAGLVGRSALTFGLQVAVLAGGQLLAGAIGPERGPDAVTVGVVVAMAVVAIAATAAGIAAARERSQRMRRLGADARMLHQRLTEALSADPERFALLTLDLDGLDGAGLGDLQETLAGQVRGQDLVARSSEDGFSILADTDGPGAEALARRIQAAVSAYHRDEIGALNASIGIALYPQDGRTPEELLASADAAMTERRAADARNLRIVSPAARA